MTARKKRSTGSAWNTVENVSDGNWYRSEETLVVALGLVLNKKKLNLDVRRFSNGTAEGCESG